MTARQREFAPIVDDVIEFAVCDFWSLLDRLRRQQGLKWDTVANHCGLGRSALGHRRVRTPKNLRIGEAQRLFAALGWTLTLTITRTDGPFC